MINEHTCETFVLICMDFRLQGSMHSALEKIGITSYDLMAHAGAAKALANGDQPAVRQWILDNIGISQRLHKSTKVVLIQHEDCGAYGGNTALGPKEQQTALQRDQLNKAKMVVQKTFPDLTVETYYGRLSEEGVRLQRI